MTEQIFRPRAGGKTWRIAQMAVDELQQGRSVVVVVPSEVMGKIVREYVERITHSNKTAESLTIRNYREVKSGALAGFPPDTKILIDNLDLMLEQIFGPCIIGAYSLTYPGWAIPENPYVVTK